jgi:bifunctional ADP-heptose synthase (sugar kinase/adenylyltransferase)
MKIVVVGDIILDQYIYGTKHKINPENLNGSVILQQKIEYKLGGAAAVASICKNLGSNVNLVGCVGNDSYGYMVKQKINGYIITVDKITTLKTRLVIDGKLYKHRLDSEDTSDIHIDLPNIECDLIIVQDYGKGFITKEFMEFLHNQDRPIIVDPCLGKDWDIYGNVDLIKCNRKEAYTDIGYNISSERLCRKICDNMVVV